MNCTKCGRESDMSVCVILSTKGRKPRIQKSSKAISLCAACIHRMKITQGVQACGHVLRALRETYTALAKQI